MNIKRWVTRFTLIPAAVIPTMVALSANQPMAEASTPKFVLAKKFVELNGKVVSTPMGFPYQKTMYMPAWYVMQALNGIQVTSSWNGTKGEWRLKVPSSIPIDYSSINPGNGSISIYINDKLVKKISGVVYTDPSSKKPTMYLPIWYAMGVFDRFGVKTTWEGTHWSMKFDKPTDPAQPPDTNVQAATIPGAVSKGTLVKDLAAALGVKGSAPAQSPFDDVPAADASLAAISTAANSHWIDAFSATHFGAGDAVSLADAEQFYWNYLNIKQAQYQPGGSLAPWAQFLGLENNVNHTQYLMATDEQQFISNLASLVNGSVQTASGVQVHYTPMDEYAATFSGAVSTSGSPIFTSSSDIQQTITNTYNFFNQITAQAQGGSVVATVPINPDGQWYVFASTTNDVEYSLDNGVSWQTASAFDSTSFDSLPSQVLLKANAVDGLSITYNRMVPQYGGSVGLGAITIKAPTSGGLQVTRLPLS